MQAVIAIRCARPGDEAVLAAIAAVVQELHFLERPDVFKAVDVEQLRDWFGKAMRKDPQRRFLLAEIGGTEVGYAAIQDGERHEDAFAQSRRWCEVDQLGVLPSHRRHGVARALVEHIAVSARAAGVPALELNTWGFNGAAHEAFRRLGFVERSVRYERPAGEPSPP